MQLEQWPIERCIEYARNPRKNDHAVDKIAAAIKEYGFRVPIVAKSDGLVVDGHLRLKAAKKLGLAQVPVILADDMTDAQIKAFRLSVNRVAQEAQWDLDLLKIELQDLDAEGFDLSLTGFNPDEIGNFLAEPTEGLTDEDAVPEVPAVPVTVEGDVWVLGRHRLMCGDSTSQSAFDALTAGAAADLIFTDPPYGMSYGGGRARGEHTSFKNRSGGIKAHGMILNDDLQGDDLTGLVRDALATSISCTKPGAPLYACFTWRTYAEFEAALESLGREVKACIVWNKQSIGLGNSHYRPQHEFIFYCGGHWHGDKSQSDVWSMSRGATGQYVHPTQKPVELVERALNNSSKSGDIVIDCFGGSGSTLIACEKTSRHARLMELDPKYCDVIVKRWQDFTGQEAMLEGSGETFKALATKRIAA